MVNGSSNGEGKLEKNGDPSTIVPRASGERSGGGEGAPVQSFIVALGASAGGLEALQEFLDNMPADSGLAFVIVTHQQPGHTSLLPELLQRHTAMNVSEVTPEQYAEPNRIYVSPPGYNLSIQNRKLSPILATHSPQPLPIDSFFRSLASDQGDNAIAIILSGTGTDGTLGLKEIKGAGGMVMAQSEESAKYPGMPLSAQATHLVDLVASAGVLPGKLQAYAEGMTQPTDWEEESQPVATPESLRQVFVLLRDRTGHDFSSYKSNTIRRRIERRMSVQHVETVSAYVDYLQKNPAEIDVLFSEILIGVTSFFRDPEAFEVLSSKTLPDLLRDKSDDEAVRVWTPACSSGEEPYSLAILIRECMERLKKRVHVQIFATDIDATAIEVARRGVFSDGIVSDVTQERLERYFVKGQNGTYRVKTEIREMIVFAPQNLIDDPPFTRLDLISCRNLLIYLDSNLQRRVLPLFHYALRPGGVLFLGSSESIGHFMGLFTPLDNKWKIFRRLEVAVGAYQVQISSTANLADELPHRDLLGDRRDVPGGHDPNFVRLANRVLLQKLVPVSLFVKEGGDIIHIHGRAGPFFEVSPGLQTVNNIFNMAREGLAADLESAIHESKAEGHGQDVWRRGLRVQSNGEHLLIDLRVCRMRVPEALHGLFLLSFENPRPSTQSDDVEDGDATQAELDLVSMLRRELEYVKRGHQITTDKLEAINEELKSTNEELQSTNEELQSSNEELETSKEEMQSLNEELQTVNAELQSKVGELSVTNDDMRNLLNGTEIATIFLDNELCVRRFTEQASKLISLIPSDVGRPIADLVSKLNYDGLVADAQEVLRSLQPKNSEVHGKQGSWYQMRILPYRTTENVIDGLVVTFVDVTEAKEFQLELRLNQDRTQKALKNSALRVVAAEVDRDLRYVWICNPHPEFDVNLVIGKCDLELADNSGVRELTDLRKRVMDTDACEWADIQFPLKAGAKVYRISAEPVHDTAGLVSGAITTSSDITELVEEIQSLQGALDLLDTPLLLLDGDLKIVSGNRALFSMLRLDQQSVMGHRLDEFSESQLSGSELCEALRRALADKDTPEEISLNIPSAGAADMKVFLRARRLKGTFLGSSKLLLMFRQQP